MRFFLDYTTKDETLYDYNGDEFQSPKDAFDFADATAESLKNSLNGDWRDWSVEVRNAEGKKYFSFPVTPGRQVATNVNAASDQSTTRLNCLLIIEDALIHSAIIGYIAGRVGFMTTEAHSYEDACKVLDTRQFDCITLDLGLGEHVGIDVLRYLSTVRCKAQIIVISQSDKDVCNDMVELGRALDLNVFESVPKPIDLKALRETLASIQASLSQPPAANPL